MQHNAKCMECTLEMLYTWLCTPHMLLYTAIAMYVAVYFPYTAVYAALLSIRILQFTVPCQLHLLLAAEVYREWCKMNIFTGLRQGNELMHDSNLVYRTQSPKTKNNYAPTLHHSNVSNKTIPARIWVMKLSSPDFRGCWATISVTCASLSRTPRTDQHSPRIFNGSCCSCRHSPRPSLLCPTILHSLVCSRRHGKWRLPQTGENTCWNHYFISAQFS